MKYIFLCHPEWNEGSVSLMRFFGLRPQNDRGEGVIPAKAGIQYWIPNQTGNDTMGIS